MGTTVSRMNYEGPTERGTRGRAESLRILFVVSKMLLNKNLPALTCFAEICASGMVLVTGGLKSSMIGGEASSSMRAGGIELIAFNCPEVSTSTGTRAAPPSKDPCWWAVRGRAASFRPKNKLLASYISLALALWVLGGGSRSLLLGLEGGWGTRGETVSGVPATCLLIRFFSCRGGEVRAAMESCAFLLKLGLIRVGVRWYMQGPARKKEKLISLRYKASVNCNLVWLSSQIEWLEIWWWSPLIDHRDSAHHIVQDQDQS
jgi:hypothetical protein